MKRETFNQLIDKSKKLMEWTEAGKSKAPDEAILDRIKDGANAPSVGDKVKIQFDEQSRGHLTPNQKEINGKSGEVKTRTPFKTGSQFARYSVEIDNSEQTVHNLSPSEVVSK